MPDILRRICEAKRAEIARLRGPGEAWLRAMVASAAPPRGFRDALAASDGVALIAEVKRASPSAGVIRADFDPAGIARAYEEGGARALSVLTDREFFQGAPEHLREARVAAALPVLRKDFILEEIQLLESRAWGADAVLLIVAALDAAQLRALMAGARALGMDALVEVHSDEELAVALDAGADIVGINNRDLRSFEVDLGTACALAPRAADGALVVAESGIRAPADVERLKASGVRAILVGETLMRADDIAAATRLLADL